jgi:hypothetical protein
MNKNQRKKIESMIKRGIKISEGITAKYSSRVKSDISYIARSCIDRFYEDYEPLIYDRHGDLYNAFEVTFSNNKIKIRYSDDLMIAEHRADNSYIFENSFIYGWHGGARSGPNHPNPGEAWWREPAPYYSNWRSPAARSDSPFEIIDKNISIYALSIRIEMMKEYKQKVEAPIIEYIRKEGIK